MNEKNHATNIEDTSTQESHNEDLKTKELDVSSTKELEDKIKALKKDLDTANKSTLMALADLENIKKRAEKRIIENHKYSLKSFIEALLPVLDSMEKATLFNAQSSESIAIQEGIKMTSKNFSGIIDKFGVREINPINELFDPEKHEAVSMLSDNNMDNGMVSKVLQKGYEINGRIVRAARVIVTQNN